LHKCASVLHYAYILPVLFLKPLKSASVQSKMVSFRNSPRVKGFTTLFIRRDATERKISYNLSFSTMFIISFHFLLHVSALFPPLVRYKGKAIPVQAYYRPSKFQDVEAARLLDSQHIKVVRLSSLHTGCLYPPRTFLVLISVRW